MICKVWNRVVGIDFRVNRYVSRYGQLNYKLAGITTDIAVVNYQSAKLMFVRDTCNPRMRVCGIDYINNANRINAFSLICDCCLCLVNKLFTNVGHLNCMLSLMVNSEEYVERICSCFRGLWY